MCIIFSLQSALFNIPNEGTHAHSFVVSFTSMDELMDRTLVDEKGQKVCTPQLISTAIILSCSHIS